jgi:hypothetical protein
MQPRVPDEESLCLVDVVERFHGAIWRKIWLGINIDLHAYYSDSGDINSVREMWLFCAEIPRKV